MCRGRRRRQSGRRPRSATPSPINVSPKKLGVLRVSDSEWSFQPAVQAPWIFVSHGAVVDAGSGQPDPAASRRRLRVNSSQFLENGVHGRPVPQRSRPELQQRFARQRFGRVPSHFRSLTGCRVCANEAGVGLPRRQSDTRSRRRKSLRRAACVADREGRDRGQRRGSGGWLLHHLRVWHHLLGSGPPMAPSCATGVFPQALPRIMPQTTRLTNRVPMRTVIHTPNAAAPRREPTSRSTLLSETSGRAVGANDLQVTWAVPHRLADDASLSRKARHGRSRSAARPARPTDTAVPNAAELLGAAALLGGKLEPFQSPLFGERARLRERASSSRKQAASDGDGRPANELAERTVLPAATCPSGRRGQLHIGSLAPMQRRIQPGIRPDVPLLPEALSPHLLVRFVAARSRPCCLASAFRPPACDVPPSGGELLDISSSGIVQLNLTHGAQTLKSERITRDERSEYELSASASAPTASRR